ncbi:MAG: endonuclease/exonuclease/phosphatase family protein [Polaribacter sp.]
MKKKSLFGKILYLINSLAAFLLLLSYLLPYISPKTFPLFAVLSLFVPALLIFNSLFIIYWLIKLKRNFLISTLVLIIGSFFSTSFYKISRKNTPLNDDIKVMSYNVRMFNHWKWNKEKDIHKKIIYFVADTDPDILTVQENMTLPKYLLNFPYKYLKKKYERGRFGIAIYSKFPIINRGFIEFKNSSNQIIFIDIVRKKDTIRVYNLHLQSLSLKPGEENFGEESSEKLIKTLKERFKMQVAQTELFVAHEQQWQGKKIISGDFNNTAYSWVYKQISEGKKDAFLEAGKGFSKTYNYWFPMRIDFILTDNSASINQYKTYSKNYSDHFPISARINWLD